MPSADEMGFAANKRSTGWISLMSNLILAAHIIIIIALSIRVLMKRRPVGVSLAWLILILILPFAGAMLYLSIGERRLGRHRVERAEALLGPYEGWLQELRMKSVRP